MDTTPVAVRDVEAEGPIATLAPSPEEAVTDQAEPPGEEAAAEAAQALPPTTRDTTLVLRLESERGTPMTFEVSRAGATLGRAPESTIRLDDLSVSRKQARIAYREGAFWLSDLGSMGGTWVDGTKLNAAKRLATGQVIDIGVCRLTVAAAPTAAQPSTSRPRAPR